MLKSHLQPMDVLKLLKKRPDMVFYGDTNSFKTFINFFHGFFLGIECSSNNKDIE